MPGLLILFHGSEGSTWFCDMLNAHPGAGHVLYEPFRLATKRGPGFDQAQKLALFDAVYGGGADAPDSVWTGDGRYPERDVPEIRARAARPCPFVKMRLEELPEDALADRLARHGVKLLVMLRRNLLKQAVSQVRKKHLRMGQKHEGRRAEPAPIDLFRAEAFALKAREAAQSNLDFAGSCGRPWMSLGYEDLQADPEGALGAVLDFVGLERKALSGAAGLVKATPERLDAAVANYADFHAYFAATEFADQLEPLEAGRAAAEPAILAKALDGRREDPDFLIYWAGYLLRREELGAAEAMIA
jgi:LPS sulfotransferase NodH